MVNYSPFSSFCNPLVYKLSLGVYDQTETRQYILVDHSDYRKSSTNEFIPLNNSLLNYENYAFGYYIDPCYSQIVPLDFDDVSFREITEFINGLLDDDNIIGIDVVQSSKNIKHKQNFHVYLGLKIPMYLLDVYNSPFIRHICYGFTHYIDSRREVIIRISQKINKIKGPDPSTLIEPIESYRRHTKNEWHVYKSNQIIFPLSSNITNKDETKKKAVLKLR
jgi:hypothetical protein